MTDYGVFNTSIVLIILVFSRIITLFYNMKYTLDIINNLKAMRILLIDKIFRSKKVSKMKLRSYKKFKFDCYLNSNSYKDIYICVLICTALTISIYVEIKCTS
eukprot:155904_1